MRPLGESSMGSTSMSIEAHVFNIDVHLCVGGSSLNVSFLPYAYTPVILCAQGRVSGNVVTPWVFHRIKGKVDVNQAHSLLYVGYDRCEVAWR